MDPESFAPGFGDRLVDSMAHWRQLEPGIASWQWTRRTSRQGSATAWPTAWRTGGSWNQYELNFLPQPRALLRGGGPGELRARVRRPPGRQHDALEAAGTGHCFVAVDPESFAPGFCDRLADSMAHWRQLEPGIASWRWTLRASRQGSATAWPTDWRTGGSWNRSFFNLGHCFVAVDPESFAPGFGDRLADSMAHWRQLEPVRAEVPSST
ncbi:Malate dehydrogenase [Operophtera brumata]|uniref:Malate dehydrogenase n=1 Tax=Operophtera brumata TaxID=104452 RepID=A0A0L7LCN2_OPEBR|nr:Malate dehydrogenase [Operophtera brumata]